MNCPSCGQVVYGKGIFCMKCGARMPALRPLAIVCFAAGSLAIVTGPGALHAFAESTAGKAMFIMILLSYTFGFTAFCLVAKAAIPERSTPPAAAAPAR